MCAHRCTTHFAWDMVIGKAVFEVEHIPAKIAVKKEAFFSHSVGCYTIWVLRLLIETHKMAATSVSV